MNINEPFLGTANLKYTDKLRRGIIIDTHYNIVNEDSSGKYETKINHDTVDIKWIEGQPFVAKNVPLSYPDISINGYGQQRKPSKGDMVLCGFVPGLYPYIVSYLKRNPFMERGLVDLQTGKIKLNEYGDPIPHTEEHYTFFAFRNLIPGEYNNISKKQAEVFMDDYGAIKHIIRSQDYVWPNYGKRLWEVSVGEKIYDESNKEIKQAMDGTNVQVQIKGHQNQFSLDISANGNISVYNNSGVAIDIRDGKISITGITGFKEPGVLGNLLVKLLKAMIGIFNSHTHAPMGPPVEQMEFEEVRSKDFFIS